MPLSLADVIGIARFRIEPVLLEAGVVAWEMQARAQSLRGKDTGNAAADALTNADLAVQELILEAVLKTPLKAAKSACEEDTALVAQLAGEEELWLGIDPINNTKEYQRGGKFWNLIFQIHGPEMPLYTFTYYPVLDWGHILYGNVHVVRGVAPRLDQVGGIERAIVYAIADPPASAPELHSRYAAQGYRFSHKDEVHPDYKGLGSPTLLLLGLAGGYYSERPRLCDGFVGQALALAHPEEFELVTVGDLSPASAVMEPLGLKVPGSYLVLRR